VRKVARDCGRCHQKTPARFRTLYDAFLCDGCYERVQAGAPVDQLTATEIFDEDEPEEEPAHAWRD